MRDALWRDRSLVKAWTLRGTLHLHPADELATWFAARRAVAPPHAELEDWRDPAGVLHPALGRDDVDATRAAVHEALDGRVLTRVELAREVGGALGPKVEARLLSGFAFLLDELCQGPPRGNRITLARPDQWIEDWSAADEQAALRDVCRRFLYAYGPARPVDFREWFAPQELTSDAARAVFDSLDLEEVDVDGHHAWVLARDVTFPDASSLRLLPEYDVYVMGFRERDHLVPEKVRERVAAHGRGRYEGPAGVRFLALDGLTAGLWERKKQARRVDLHVDPIRKLSRAEQRLLDVEAARIGAFLGVEPVVTVG